MATQQEIEDFGFERCDFDDECDFCITPQQGSYAKMSRSECGAEAEYYICGKCASEIIKEGKAESAHDVSPVIH
jgi:hypothetical protein